MTPPPRIRVVIVDDHQIVIDGIRSLLEQAAQLEFCGSANSGAAALQFLADHHADIVLLDLNMPEMSGLETCKRLLQQHPGLGVIALTMLDEPAMIRAMIEAGAAGYLLKNVGYEELVTAIERVFAGKSHYSKRVGDILLQPADNPDTARNAPSLSRRELQILDLIMQEMTNIEIAEHLFISVNTVDSHRRNIMSKLGVKNTAGMVRVAMERGLLERPD